MMTDSTARSLKRLTDLNDLLALALVVGVYHLHTQRLINFGL